MVVGKKNLGHVWFTGRAEIGVVLCLIDGVPKAYISTILGLDEDEDIKHITDWGSKFPIAEAASLIKKNGTIVDQEVWDNTSFIE